MDSIYVKIFSRKMTSFRGCAFKNIPKLTRTKQDLLDLCYTSEHLGESTTMGETFMVKWYKEIERLETKALIVFKLDGK